MSSRIPPRQQGVALVVALVMLTIMTMMLVTALNMTNSNLRSVGNVQFRNEAIAAANAAIEERLSSNFDSAAQTSSAVDIDNDDQTDYLVTVTPSCIRAFPAGSSAASSLSLPALATASNWHTFWDIDADIEDADSGAAMRIHAGVRVLLTDDEKNTACP